jgi:hypothetical protein
MIEIIILRHIFSFFLGKEIESLITQERWTFERGTKRIDRFKCFFANNIWTLRGILLFYICQFFEYWPDPSLIEWCIYIGESIILNELELIGTSITDRKSSSNPYSSLEKSTSCNIRLRNIICTDISVWKGYIVCRAYSLS